MKAELVFLTEKDLIENFQSNYLVFRIAEQKPKTVKIIVGNIENQILGVIAWYPPFRKYSYFPSGTTVYERTCLNDIVTLLDELEAIRKNRKPLLIHKENELHRKEN
jgi:hypothetical protein